MAMSKKLLKALNDQANMEFGAAYIYLGFAYDMDDLNLKGYAHWLHKQYDEEIEHAMKILNFIQDRGEKVELAPIPPFGKHLDCPVEVAKASLAHEQKVSASIRNIFALAREENDPETELLMQWYINEQIEEEVNARENLDRFEDCKDCKGSAYFYDAELAKR